MIGEAELRALLSIRALPGIGDVRLTALLLRHASATRAWEAIRADRPDAAARVSQASVAARIEHALRSVLDSPGIVAIAAYHDRYPASLRDLHDPPPILFVRGASELLERPAVAIVGTRACTEYGAEAARSIADVLASAGITVISGLAHGVDRHAHEAALDAGGGTVAVIGCGIDVVYPHQHQRLHDRIAQEGLLVSEFLPGEPALPHHFPRRNRLIAALSRAVVVVEAPERSGALITADHALDLGREVLAVPGPIGRRTSAGTNALIRDGASVVTSAADVLAAVSSELPRGSPPRWTPDAAGPEPSRPEGTGRAWSGPEPSGAPAREEPVRFGTGSAAAAVAATLTEEPRHIDELALTAGLDASVTLAALLELELLGFARASAGARYSRPAARSLG